MAKARTKAKTFNGFSYRGLQQHNSEHRRQLSRENQAWLKQNGYRNAGWSNVIRLHQQIDELLEKERFGEQSLEDLFLTADRIGQKYQTTEEIAQFEQQLAQEAEEIAEITDQLFPDTEPEMIDFSQGHRGQTAKRRGKR